MIANPKSLLRESVAARCLLDLVFFHLCRWLCLEAILCAGPRIVSSVGLFVPVFPGPSSNMLACKMDRDNTHPSVPQECAKAVGEECGGPWEVNQSLDFDFHFYDHEP